METESDAVTEFNRVFVEDGPRVALSKFAMRGRFDELPFELVRDSLRMCKPEWVLIRFPEWVSTHFPEAFVKLCRRYPESVVWDPTIAAILGAIQPTVLAECVAVHPNRERVVLRDGVMDVLFEVLPAVAADLLVEFPDRAMRMYQDRLLDDAGLLCRVFIAVESSSPQIGWGL